MRVVSYTMYVHLPHRDIVESVSPAVFLNKLIFRKALKRPRFPQPVLQLREQCYKIRESSTGILSRQGPGVEDELGTHQTYHKMFEGSFGLKIKYNNQMC